jgi:hypothetical protein
VSGLLWAVAQSAMPEEHNKLIAARRDIPRLAMQHGTKREMAEAFAAEYAEIVAILGHVLLPGYLWQQLRHADPKIGAQAGLPCHPLPIDRQRPAPVMIER